MRPKVDMYMWKKTETASCQTKVERRFLCFDNRVVASTEELVCNDGSEFR